MMDIKRKYVQYIVVASIFRFTLYSVCVLSTHTQSERVHTQRLFMSLYLYRDSTVVV